MKHVMSYVRFKGIFLFGLFSVFVVLGGSLSPWVGAVRKRGAKARGAPVLP